MTFDLETTYALLPAIYRIRDAQLADPGQDGPLKALLSVIVEQIAILEDAQAQLYDDHFIETCADWVIPYIGDLIGVRNLQVLDGPAGNPVLTSRAEVANTIGYRRRKGTAGMLEPMVRDVTGWYARAVEFFRLIASTQYLNRPRLENHLVDVRLRGQLARLGTPFDTLDHTVDVRHIVQRRGRYNLPSIGIFIWRLWPYSLTDSPAVRHANDPHRYLFSPLGSNTQLYTLPQVEEGADRPLYGPKVGFTQHAEPINLPMPITRQALQQHRAEYYGAGNSFLINVDGQDVAADRIVAADLSDEGNDWRNRPENVVAVDPVLGRVAFPAAQPAPDQVRVTFHYGFSASMGGGEYGRAASLAEDQFCQPAPTPPKVVQVQEGESIQAALQGLNGDGVVEIVDSGRYEESISITVATGGRIELRAADGHRPTLVLKGDLRITSGQPVPDPGQPIQGRGQDSTAALNGLLVVGGRVRATGQLSRLIIQHSTLVPGLAMSTAGAPRHPEEPSLVVEAPSAALEIDSSILGGVRVASRATARITHSIVDATAQSHLAYAAPAGAAAGGQLHVENSTVIGFVHTEVIELASNTIFLAHSGQHDTASPVLAERKQIGCVRFSFVPPGSRVPAQYRCQPLPGSRLRPFFTSLRYGHPGYCQLSRWCPLEIRQGADDGSEMGAFHDLYQPQREANLQTRLQEYLGLGLEAGIFYET